MSPTARSRRSTTAGVTAPAVPGPSYADTTGEVGRRYWYGVASLSSADGAHGPVSEPVDSASTAAAGAVEIRVDAGDVVKPLARPWHMVGSEHLSQLFYPRNGRGVEVGQEFEQSLRIARAELGIDRVRAHGVLLDDLNLYREQDGDPIYDFTGVDRVYDRVLSLGLRPVVELSFMPRALAANPSQTVFGYRAIISPPKYYRRWGELIECPRQSPGRSLRHR